MPYNNLTRVILSTRLADKVTVLRRTQTINEYGRVLTGQKTFPRVTGVVTMAGPDDMDRLDDNQRMGRVISFVSKFKVQGPAQSAGQQYQPDQIVWYGDTYVVATVDPYPQYGPGFTQALAYSVDSIDQTVTFDPIKAGGLIFDRPQNSQWAAMLLDTPLAPPPIPPSENFGGLIFDYAPNGIWAVPFNDL